MLFRSNSIRSCSLFACFTTVSRFCSTLRTMSALATRCEPDAQGRILLPQRLRQYAQLEKEVIIIGVFDRAEIWNAQRWTEIEEEALSSGSLEKAMQRMGL